jgi:hypothetical protein
MLVPGPVQSTYQQYINIGQNGMPATTTGWDVDTRIFEDTSGDGIGFGLAVSQSYKTDRGAVLGQLSGFNFVGIAVSDITLPAAAARLTPDVYYDQDNMATAVRGDWWVVVGDAVAAGGAVYMNSVTGQLGASGITNAVLIKGARWMTSAAMSGLAVVRLNMVSAD